MFNAIANNKLDEVKKIHQNGYKLTRSLFNWSAICGNLEVMKWLHSEGCQFDEYTYISAAKNGDLEIIKWLHELGCPCNIGVYIDSIKENEETLELVKLVNCEVFDEAVEITSVSSRFQQTYQTFV
jgi:sarcosine oxidase delta subunit